jgi:hypothetical protein
MISVEANVDRGELKWRLTQILAGIKNCDEKAINPLTDEGLLGATGYDKVQSRNVCFPLHVNIAKDKSAFYDRHLSGFLKILIHLRMTTHTVIGSLKEQTCALYRNYEERRGNEE